MNYFLNVIDLYTYFGGGTRKYVEGQNVADANHIMYCGILNIDNENTDYEVVDIIALCL